MRLTKILDIGLGFKQLFLAKPAKGYVIFDGTRRVEFDHLYFMTFHVCGEPSGKKRKALQKETDSPKMRVYLANSSRKRNMVPVLFDMIMGIQKKGRGLRVYECSEASLHLCRPLAVHVDGESCMCQQDIEIRCIPKQIRRIGS